MKILVIDDEKDITNIVKIALELEGFKVLTANSGQEGIEIASRNLPDLILLDVMMPGMDGWSVYSSLRKNPKTKDIKIAMLTAKALKEDVQKGVLYGVSDYITKPFDPIGLPARVRDILVNG